MYNALCCSESGTQGGECGLLAVELSFHLRDVRFHIVVIKNLGVPDASKLLVSHWFRTGKIERIRALRTGLELTS
jgi:hypothetical protein